MWVVAYLWNNNGMGTWCWEAAHALAERGREVLLICSSSVSLPGPSAVPLLGVDPPATGKLNGLQKIKRELARLSTRPQPILPAIHQQVLRSGYSPDAYLLNSTDFINAAVPVPQCVVGWAYPTSFVGYAKKVTIYSRPSLSRHFVRGALDTLGWYRKDWNGYRRAEGVMAVSKRLEANLCSHGVRSVVVHPGTAQGTLAGRMPDGGPVRLVMAAANLDDPRKRIHWMLDALAAGPRRDFRLLLIGAASTELESRTRHCGLDVQFVGSVPRDQVQELMQQQDLFLFGSRLDDWGYVLVEAMSQGLAVIAPDLSPFDEIIGNDGGVTYRPYAPASFREAVYNAMGADLGRLKLGAAARALERFSRDAFGRALEEAVQRFVPEPAGSKIER